MIAMQYSFALPADYDMSIIERRVQEKGHALDNHVPLSFKAYLVARKDDPIAHSHENLYAPFYLWHSCEGLRDFITSAGFVGLVNSFGWPSVRSWPALISTQQTEYLALARFASREFKHITPFSDLQELQKSEDELCRGAVENEHALLALTAFEPTTWGLVRFRLWRDVESLPSSREVQSYHVLHVSNPVPS
jgi:hypothetical protein